jgi:chemotaxis protein methyltransferase CheR
MAREFEFTDGDYDRVAELVYRLAGIHLGDTRREMVYSRLSREVRRLRLSKVADYLNFLEQAGQHEWTRFVNVLTTNLTSFFREPHHFAILKEKVLPHASRPARIWSCGCASGEEPYSIAMSCLENANGSAACVNVLATDINTTMLQTAEAGVYDQERVQWLEQERLKKFFLRGSGAFEGSVKVKDELRQCVNFRMLNLTHPVWNIDGQFDAIFCRNVMIYFDKATQYQILKRFVPLLRQPHGLLFAGHSEAFFHAKDILMPLGATTYKAIHGAIDNGRE